MTWGIVSVWNRASTAWNYARHVDTIPASPGHLTNSYGHLLDEIQTNNLFNDLIPSQERIICFPLVSAEMNLTRSRLRLSHILISRAPGLPGLSLGSLAVSPCQLGAHVAMLTSNIISGTSLCRMSPCKANLGDKKHLTNQDWRLIFYQSFSYFFSLVMTHIHVTCQMYTNPT